jgi:hypothetical protein
MRVLGSIPHPRRTHHAQTPSPHRMRVHACVVASTHSACLLPCRPVAHQLLKQASSSCCSCRTPCFSKEDSTDPTYSTRCGSLLFCMLSSCQPLGINKHVAKNHLHGRRPLRVSSAISLPLLRPALLVCNCRLVCPSGQHHQVSMRPTLVCRVLSADNRCCIKS